MNSKWYAIYRDLTFKIFSEPSIEVQCDYWLYKEETGRFHTTQNNNRYSINQFKLFDSQLKECSITIGGWRITKITDPDQKHAYSTTIVEIADKKNQTRSLKLGHDLDGLLQGMAFLIKNSKYASWEELEDAKEIEKLKEIISKYKEYFSALKASEFFIEGRNYYDSLKKKNASEIEWKEYYTRNKITPEVSYILFDKFNEIDLINSD